MKGDVVALAITSEIEPRLLIILFYSAVMDGDFNKNQLIVDVFA